MILDVPKLILTRPAKGMLLRKIGAAVNVVFFWCVTIYMMKALWLEVSRIFKIAILGVAVEDGETASQAGMFFMYVGLIVLAALALYGWAAYNRYRYGGRRDKRRVHPPALAEEDVCEYIHATPEKLHTMKSARILVAHFDERREIKEYDCYADVGVPCGRLSPETEELLSELEAEPVDIDSVITPEELAEVFCYGVTRKEVDGHRDGEGYVIYLDADATLEEEPALA